MLPGLKAKGRVRGNIKMALFWSAHQRFYRQMLMAAKVGGGEGIVIVMFYYSISSTGSSISTAGISMCSLLDGLVALVCSMLREM